MGSFDIVYQPQKSRLRPEKVVRPFIMVETQADTPVKPKRVLPGSDDEAYIEWGQTANFNASSEDNDPVENQEWRTEFEVLPKDEEKKEDITFTEQSRNEEEIRVENPDDPDSYVMVKRITEITFKGKKGGTYKFVLNNG